jgi:glutamine synthetase
MLQAGLDGIKKKLIPAEPVEEDVYEFDERKLIEKGIETLPASLGEAMFALKEDKLVQEALGKHSYETYLLAKKEEYDNYRIQVTKWELEKYFENT